MTRALLILFIVVFVGLTGINLIPVSDDSIVGFSGFFYFLRWVSGAGHQPFSDYLKAACKIDVTCMANWHASHVRFSWGFVYPLLAVLYSGFAEAFRLILPADVSYLEVLVRAGSSALVAHWLVFVCVVAAAIFQVRDAELRAKVSAALALAVIFDYFVHNNYGLFNGHRLFVHLHDGFGYAMTIWAPRGAVSVILGLYLAARALDAWRGRLWLIPAAFAFHIAVATIVCVVLLVTETVVCAVRWKPTRDLWALTVCAAFGIFASGTFAFTGYPDPSAGVLPAQQILQTVVRQALTRPLPLYFALLGVGSSCLLTGILSARSRNRAGAATVLVTLSVISGVFFIQFATGQGIVARVLDSNNTSVHSLLYVFTYSSSAVSLGLSVWLIVRGGELMARLAGRISTYGAIALVASLGFLTVFAVVAATSRTAKSHVYAVLPRRPVGEVVVQIWEPERWNLCYVAVDRAAPRMDDPRLAFADRRLFAGNSWLFNAIIYLRGLHQWAVLGPIGGKLEVIPWTPGPGSDSCA